MVYHSKKLDIFYKEHRDQCSNCKHKFKHNDLAYLGYLSDGSCAILCEKCKYLLRKPVTPFLWTELEYSRPNPDDKLWRYMDLAKFLSLISHKALYFAAAKSFKDPFEGAKGVVCNKQSWDNFHLEFFREAILTAPGQDLKKLTEEKIKSDSHRLLKSLSSIGLQAREDTYICCWHQNDYESEAMWQLYSNDIANAIAIQTTTRRLYVSIGKDPRIDIGNVSYIDFTKRFSSINGSFWYKRKAFEHEREVRAIIYDPQQKSSGIYIPCNINELIEKIYISPYAHKWFFNLVIEILKKYRIKKTVLQSELIQIPFY